MNVSNSSLPLCLACMRRMSPQMAKVLEATGLEEGSPTRAKVIDAFVCEVCTLEILLELQRACTRTPADIVRLLPAVARLMGRAHNRATECLG